jgi:Na+/H+-dicarboxylate symporter
MMIPEVTQQSYWKFLWQIIPDNIVQSFVQNNVLGIAFFGLLLGVSILQLEQEPKEQCKKIFSSIFAAILNIAGMVIKIMPIGVWAFVALLVSASVNNPSRLTELMIYTLCVLGANVVQGFVVLPLLLKYKGVSPQKTFKGLWPALVTAFFTKSSSATMPVTLTCLKKNLKINEKTANTTVPLCTVINMNGCAAFIVVTVLFVAMSHGVTFSAGEMVLWTVMATIAALGNAGVPMGCYFLTSAFLTSMNLPLTLLGWILPIYVVIDMVETALNVWSDGCIAMIIDKEEQHQR